MRNWKGEAVHIPSHSQLAELLACPVFARLAMTERAGGIEPALIFKNSSLALKYLVRGAPARLLLIKLPANALVYDIEVRDDPEFGDVAWSIVENSEEMAAMLRFLEEGRCAVHLFNDLAVNVASGVFTIEEQDKSVRQMVIDSVPAAADTVEVDTVHALIDVLRAEEKHGEVGAILDLTLEGNWEELRSYYVTGGKSHASQVDLFSLDEGQQQENLAVWLTDALHPAGCFLRPQVVLPRKSRELCDVLLTYEFGSFLVESKTLALFAREKLPTQDDLRNDAAKHVRKAVGQLSGAIRSLKSGHKVTDAEGRELPIVTDQPSHAIVLVPELHLLAGQSELGGPLLRSFGKRTGAMLQILDPADLLRLVQGAEMVSDSSETLTRLHAFDTLLMRRFRQGLESETPDFHHLFRLE